MDRRQFLITGGAAGVALALPLLSFAGVAAAGPLTRAIPSSGQQLPVIGMGSWITFNVGRSHKLRQKRLEVLKEFFAHGGGMIDSSPMYGSSEEVIGWGLEQLGRADGLFSATKVWTVSKSGGIVQMGQSQDLWGERPLDLIQIHNLLDWEAHLATLKSWKEAGRLKYLGITTSHGRRHGDMTAIMAAEPLDFVQFTYNIGNREAEQRLLPLAADRGQAVIINRPFMGGRLIDKLQRHPLPDWASEIECREWSQIFC